LLRGPGKVSQANIGAKNIHDEYQKMPRFSVHFLIYETDSKSASIFAFFTAIFKYFSNFLMLHILALDFEAKRS
jgi:hypothetical protein